ncbi:hypothetical protein ACSHT0_07990 [Tepidicaulis sp. LMO-SS28]|uniref:hypothetical protein n=1 Tax=Tepidicaulis sp. LMO-SS28 TaxID=3447455 RepID=UPI003EDEA330
MALVVVIATVAIAGSTNSVNPTGHQITASERDTHANGELAPAEQFDTDGAPTDRPMSAGTGNQKPDQNDCEAEAEKESIKCRDLAAQENVAKWTLLTALLTGVGVYLIWRTLSYTAEAADFAARTLKEAEKATKAANLTVDETRRIGEAQVRAYLTIKEVSVSFERINIKENTLYMKITVSVKNSGASPARDFVFNASVLKIMGGNPEQFSEGREVAPRGFGEDIAPDEPLSTSIGIHRIPVTEAEISDLEIMDMQLYARIDARFFDVFDNGPLHLSGNYAARITKNSLRQPNVMRKTPMPPEIIFATRQEARQGN